MKILKKILIYLSGFIALLLIAAIFMPKKYRAESSIVIQSPSQKVMEYANSLKKQQEWSPWAEIEPMQVTYAGIDGQTGSSSSWKGDKVGSGTQTITSIGPNRMDSRLDFKEPFESTCNSFFIANPEGSGTRVTWGIEGEDPYPLNLMIPIMNMSIKKDFNKGLEKLKALCEKQN